MSGSLRQRRSGNVVEILSGFAFKSDSFNDLEGMPIIRVRNVVRGSQKPDIEVI